MKPKYNQTISPDGLGGAGVWIATRQYGPDDRGRHDVTHRRPPPPPAIGVDLLTLLQQSPTLENKPTLPRTTFVFLLAWEQSV